MKKILKEPLLHFLLIGAALFILYGFLNQNSDDKNTIVITDYDVNNITSTWELQWKRPPTEKELQNLIYQNVKQEIFYQEALKMNLDHNDEIIKRRLSQKMQFLSNDVVAMIEPTADELKKYYNTHSVKYLNPPSYSLYQIAFSPENHIDNYEAALRILKQFPNASFQEMENKGDQLPFSYFMEDLSTNELALQLGSKFPVGIEKQVLNKWVGPIPSGFGYHLVYITKKSASKLKDYESIKNEVIRDFEYDRQKEMDETIFKELKKKYEIDIDINAKDFDPTFVKYLETEFNK